MSAKTVLYVEDNEVNRRLVRDLLKRTTASRGRGGGGMKGLALLSLAAMLILCAGCAARPDWIQATLVTTDVTGTWRGASSSASPLTLTLVLKQRGSKVTGTALVSGRGGAGPLEGSVEGDVFRFATTFGLLRGEVTVAGDEMSGEMSSGTGRGRLFLRRGEPSVSDTQEKQ